MDATLHILARKCPLLAQVPVVGLPSLFEGRTERSLNPGEALFRCGDDATEWFLILEGEVVLSTTSASGGVIGLRLTSGETVGLESILAGSNHATIAIAATPTRVLALPAQGFTDFLEGHFETAIAMISAMAQGLRDRVREITELKMQSTAERLASYLLALAGNESGRIVVRLPLEKRRLADHLGMDPATLSRAFAKLREKGVTANRTDRVEIADVARLRDYGESAAIAQ